jgi:plastocyanin
MKPGPQFVVAVLVMTAIVDPARARTVRILMENLVLRPSDASAKIGDTVEWTNDDMVTHTHCNRQEWRIRGDRAVEEHGSARATEGRHY